jgi:hypothetical protein
MSCFDISQPRSGVDQRVRTVDDGPAGFGQFGHGEQVLGPPGVQHRPGPVGFSGPKRQNSGAYSAVSVWSAVLKFSGATAIPEEGHPMITADVPAWLRRSDQAVSWARTMLTPRRAVVIDCETTDLPGGVTGNDGYQNLRNSTRARTAPLTENRTTAELSAPNGTVRAKIVSRSMQNSCI